VRTALAILGFALALLQEEPYKHPPESERQEGVPKGRILHETWKSRVFEGTLREYWVYVPAQYDGTSPAAVMVFQDGHAYVNEKGWFRVPIVFDVLIAKGEMPVTIGIFLNPGHKSETLPKPGWEEKNNRSFEYDTLSDRYARFLIEEILPEVGKTLKLTGDPDGRAICGISSGGICAFTAAWDAPEAAARLPPGRREGPGQPVRKLVAREPSDGRRASLRPLRLHLRRRRGRPQRQARRLDPPRFPPLALARVQAHGPLGPGRSCGP
jgi:hypothetical protein